MRGKLLRTVGQKKILFRYMRGGGGCKKSMFLNRYINPSKHTTWRQKKSDLVTDRAVNTYYFNTSDQRFFHNGGMMWIQI
jgi:hypothetical protein